MSRSTARIRLAASALALALAATLAPVAAHADGADDVTWAVRTASNQYGQDRTGFEYALDPGATVDDGLVVLNRGTEPLTLSVYAADGFTTDTGQLDVLAGGEESRAVGAWVTASGDTVTVAPGETATVPFSLTVPANATPGDYAGAVVTSLKGENDTGISVDRRLGIRISLRVGGALAPAMSVDGVQLGWTGGFLGLPSPTTVTYTVHNTGNTSLGAQQEATIGGPFGWFTQSADPIDDVAEILPGESRTVTASVPVVAPLVWLLGTVAVTPVEVDASGSTALLDPIVATATGWAVPWLLLVLLVVVAALVVGGVILRRRRRTAAKAREDERVAAAVAEALERERVDA
jgi:hypothetical protein